MKNWFSHVLHRTRTDPHKPAMVMEDRVITYGMLHDAIERCARRIVALDIPNADQVAVVVRNPIRHVILCYALFRTRVRGVSLEHGQAGIAALKFSAVLGDREAKAAVDPGNRFVEVGDEWFAVDLPAGAPLPQPFADADDVYRLSFTSGSTGIPKVVPRQVGGTTRTILKFLDTNWNIVLPMPGLSIHWGFMTVCAALATGRTVCFADSPFQAMRMIQLFSIDFVVASTEQVLALTRVVRAANTKLKSLQTILTGGTVPTRPLLEAALIHLCNDIVVRYGAAEMGAIAHASAREILNSPGLVGHAAPEIDVAVFDRIGNILPPGQVGVIHARHEGATDWVNLDDAGWLSADGRIFVVGRASDANALTPRISPALEIEHLVRLEWDMDDAGAISIGEGQDQRISMAIVGNRSVTSDAVASLLKSRGLANRVDVIHLAAIPRTASGKINRKDLAESMKVNAPSR